MEKENKQHVQLPNNMGEINFIKPKDQLVYVAIKRFMNKDTKEAFPSLETLHQLTGIYINGIRECIKNLEKAGYIEVRKEGRKNIYKFLKHEHFEPFSFKFIEKQDLSTTEKSYLIASQQYMFKDGEEGKISMPNKELSKKINMPESTISKVNKSLVSKEYATIVPTHNRDPETGLFIKEKFYHLTKLEQAIVFILKNHEDRITENTEDIKDLKEKNQSLEENLQTTQKDLQMALRRIAELEKQNKHEDIVL